MKNIVKFAQGKDTAFLCGLFRYDYGQQLIIEGLELPDDFEVHFQTQGDTAPVIKGCKSGNEYSVSIPDEILQQAVDETKAWIYLDNKTSGKTIKTIVMHLNDRDKPSDYPLQEDVATVKGYAEYVKENAERVSQAQVAGDRANTIADELIRAKENGEFNGKDAEPIAVDCKLSEESNNPISNGAVAKVLGGGKLIGIEKLTSYDDLLDFTYKYYDLETGDSVLGDNEYGLLFVTTDIFDESGEYNDPECIMKKALYVWDNVDLYAIGEASQEELEAVIKTVNGHTANLEKLNTEIDEKADTDLLVIYADGFAKLIHDAQFDIDEINKKLTEFEQSSIPQISVSETTATIQPNVYYCFGEVTELIIALGEEKQGVVNEYMFEFISGKTPTNLTLPADIKWATEIDVAANKKYQVSIVNHIGLMAGVDI